MNAKFIAMFATVAAATLFATASQAYAFPHAVTVITPNTSDPNQQHAKPVTVVLGHTNEPAFGRKAGLHDGKHGVEVFLEDQATGLPLAKSNLKVDKYYFKDIKDFNKASSVNQATQVQTNVPLPGAFGDPGHYLSRQVQKDGIYGYRLYGIINYFDVAQIPIDATVFCRSTAGDTYKFNTPGWFGGYGCTDRIQNIFFPSKGGDD
jgi:hypothetical protein